MLTEDGKHLYVSYDEYHNLIEKLAIKIHQSDWQFDTILCLARGGMRPGDILSRIFDKPLAIMSTSSYRADAGTTQGNLDIARFITTPKGEIAGRVLLVDDLADTGYTLNAVINQLCNNYKPITELRSAVIWSKGISSFRADYSVIPWCTFTAPEAARVGLSEQQAREQNIDVEVTRYGIGELDRAITDNVAQGFVKVLTRKGSDKILGAAIVGAHAGDMMAEYVLAMKHGIGLNKILGTIHIYPTMAEANKYAAGEWKRANAPQRLLAIAERFHRWRRAA